MVPVPDRSSGLQSNQAQQGPTGHATPRGQGTGEVDRSASPPAAGRTARSLGQVVRWFWHFAVSNGDTVVPVALALVLGILSLAGKTSTDQLVTGTLGVLTLLSLSALRDRLQRDETLRTMRRLNDEITDLTVTARALGSSRETHISRDQEANNDYLITLIRELPNIQAAKFLAFSGRDARVFVEQVLERSDCPVQLLIKHPDTVGHVQQRWILAELDRMRRYLLPKYGDRLQIRCYRQPYSLRGRKLEPHVVDVGWYTPKPGDPVEVVGHRNPLVTARLNSEGGVAISKMFDEVFEALWNAADSEDASAISTA